MANNFFNVQVPQSFFFTPEGGICVYMINKTGAPTVKGYLVHPSLTVDNAFVYNQIDEPDIIGIVYDAGVPDGQLCKIVITGKAHVYYMNAVTREWFGRNREGAEGGSDGQAIGETVPTAPFATNKHFQEIGHILETTGGAGLALTDLHFN
jgi:hypothetical protein